MEYAGIKFPANLDTPYSVAQVLLQEPGKLRMKDIREGKGIIADTRDETYQSSDIAWHKMSRIQPWSLPVKIKKVFAFLLLQY